MIKVTSNGMRRLLVMGLVVTLGIQAVSATPVWAQTVTAVNWVFFPAAPTFNDSQTVSFGATVTDTSGSPVAGSIYIESMSGPLTSFYNNTAASNQVVLNSLGQATLTAPPLSPPQYAPGQYQVKTCYKQSASTGSLCTTNALTITVTATSTTAPTTTTPTSSTGSTGTTATTEDKKAPIVFDPEIEIPFFSNQAIDSSTFARYLRAIFITFIWGVGILATFMTVYGGVRWVAAAGNPARINQAKDIVYNSIIGVVIALTAVILLSLLDPKLVNFQGLSATDQLAVKGIPYGDNNTGKFGEGVTCLTKGGNPVQQESTCKVTDNQMVWPVTGVTQTINSRVGPRDPDGVGSKCHPGTDFFTDRTTGHPIVAPHGGTVRNVTANVAGEYSLELHSINFYTRYLHVKQPRVKDGDILAKGALLGLSGGDPNDGEAIAAWSGGPHLHLELYSLGDELHDIFPCLQVNQQ